MRHLAGEHCVPCEGGMSPLTVVEAEPLRAKIGAEWKLKNGKLIRTFKFKSFEDGLVFVNCVGVLAGKENHHPDIEIHYTKVTLTLSTHAINGLSKNDFVLAAKINGVVAKKEEKRQ